MLAFINLVGLNFLISVYFRIKFDDTSNLDLRVKFMILKLGPFAYYKIESKLMKFRASSFIVI